MQTSLLMPWDRGSRGPTDAPEPPSEAQAPDHWFVADSLDQMLNERGRTPLDAARIVFDGVRARQFWICTADDDMYQSLMRSRYDAILEHQLPPGAVY